MMFGHMGKKVGGNTLEKAVDPLISATYRGGAREKAGK